MLPTAGSVPANSLLNNSRVKAKLSLASLGLASRKKKAEAARRYNIEKLKTKSMRAAPEMFKFNPKVSESFLESWLDFPVDQTFPVMINSMRIWLIWLVWTNKSMAGLDPTDPTIRSRIISQISVLGTAAGLFLVIAIAGFLVPPQLHHEGDEVLIDIFGCLMFASSVALIFYIGVALTGKYPLVESLRDDVAFEAFENYQTRVGGYEVYLFFAGMNLMTIALIVAARILYSDIALYVMLGTVAVVAVCVTHLSVQTFLALDPISSMHMGLSNNPDDHHRAELMSHFIMRKVPNHITSEVVHEEVFHKHTESKKLEETRKSQLNFKPLDVHKFTEDANADANANANHVHLFAHPEQSHSTSDKTVPTAATGSTALKKVSPVVENNLEVYNIEEKEAPLSARTKPGTGTYIAAPAHALSSTQDAAQNAHDSRRGTEHDILNVELMDLFCGSGCIFLKHGMSSADASKVYDHLIRNGCTTTKEFVTYLNEHKQARAEGICNCTAPDRERGVHSMQCGSRVAGMWVEGLTNISISPFQAVKIIRAMKNYLD